MPSDPCCYHAANLQPSCISYNQQQSSFVSWQKTGQAGAVLDFSYRILRFKDHKAEPIRTAT